jgi:hypothetical protein
MSGKTRPLGAPPEDHLPIERTAEMTGIRALDLAMWALRSKLERIQEDAEWLGLDDAPIRFRRVEVTQALFKLQKIRDQLIAGSQSAGDVHTQ